MHQEQHWRLHLSGTLSLRRWIRGCLFHLTSLSFGKLGSVQSHQKDPQHHCQLIDCSRTSETLELPDSSQCGMFLSSDFLQRFEMNSSFLNTVDLERRLRVECNSRPLQASPVDGKNQRWAHSPLESRRKFVGGWIS